MTVKGRLIPHPVTIHLTNPSRSLPAPVIVLPDPGITEPVPGILTTLLSSTSLSFPPFLCSCRACSALPLRSCGCSLLSICHPHQCVHHATAVDQGGENLFIPLLRSLNKNSQGSKRSQNSKKIPKGNNCQDSPSGPVW